MGPPGSFLSVATVRESLAHIQSVHRITPVKLLETWTNGYNFNPDLVYIKGDFDEYEVLKYCTENGKERQLVLLF